MQTALFQQRRLCRCVCTRGSYSSLKMGNSQMWARVWAHIWLKHESLRWWRRRQRLQRDVPVWKHYTHYLPAAGCNSLLFCRFSLFFPTVSGFQEKHGETCRHAEQWGCCESLKVNVDCELILNTQLNIQLHSTVLFHDCCHCFALFATIYMQFIPTILSFEHLQSCNVLHNNWNTDVFYWILLYPYKSVF